MRSPWLWPASEDNRHTPLPPTPFRWPPDKNEILKAERGISRASWLKAGHAPRPRSGAWILARADPLQHTDPINAAAATFYRRFGSVALPCLALPRLASPLREQQQILLLEDARRSLG